ncbi:MAG TPA: TonB-dependent receptor, partial [Pirellula sp.]|nr:TonB-dependent receptor [Pirellula sp.]
ERGFVGLRYGGQLGQRTFYRIFGRFLDRDSLFLDSAASAKDEYGYGQSGFVVDSALGQSNGLRVQGDIYSGQNGLRNRPDVGIHGGNLLARWTHTQGGRSQLQVQTYFDRTSRLVPNTFDETRYTYDLDMQHRLGGLRRHDVVWGLGYRVSTDRTKPQPTLFFEPSGRNLALLNFFAEDDISLTDSLHLILGGRLEHNSYTGWEAYPTARLAWMFNNQHTLWGAVSRAVRIPTQFDRDLRIGPSDAPFISGDVSFEAEELIAYEVGYRSLLTERLGLGVALYYNDYDNLRSQEGPIGGGFPIVLANNLQAKTYGAEINATFNPLPWWRLRTSYNNMQKNLSFRPGSTDATQGLQEGSDPRNQFSFRSQMDLPRRTTLDFFTRYASSLHLPRPNPPVDSYLVFDVTVGWEATQNLEFSVVGRNLPERRHKEFGPQGEQIPRDVFGIVRWHF